MTGIVEKQIRAMLEKFRTEVANAASQSGKGFKSLGEDVRGAESRIKDLIGTTQRLSKDGSVVSTQKGYDELNRVIVEVTKNGELLSRTMKADSTLTKDIQYANELYKQQIDALRQLNALKTQRLTVKDDTPTAVHLDEQILKTGQLIQRNRELISAFDEQAVKRSNLSRLATEEAALDAKYLSAQIRAQEQAADAAAKRELAERGGADQIRQTQQALNQLSQAYRGIQTAAKNGDESSKAYWTQKANAAKDELAAIESGLGKLNIEEGARERIVAMIRQAGDAEQTHARTMDELGSKTNDFAQA